MSQSIISFIVDIIALKNCRLPTRHNSLANPEFYCDDFENGILRVFAEFDGIEKLGFLNATCEEIVPFGRFSYGDAFKDGLALVEEAQTGWVGYIDTEGHWVYRSNDWGDSIW